MKIGSTFSISLVTIMAMVKSIEGTGFCAELAYPATGMDGAGNVDEVKAISFTGDEQDSKDVLVSCTLECEDGTFNGDIFVGAGNQISRITNFDCLSSGPVELSVNADAVYTGEFFPRFWLIGTVTGPIRAECVCTNRESSGGGCFSPDTTVQVQGEGEVSLGDLKVGSQILTDAATQQYETVYAMAHKDLATPTDFLQLFMESNKPLEVTADHFMFKQGQSSPVRADALQVGDVMEGGLELTKIGQVTLKGRVTPLTSSGKVVVNGLTQASNYIDYEHGTTLFGTDYTNAMSHFFISPFRLLCTANPSSDYCVETNAEGIPTGLNFLKEYASTAMASNMFVQGSMLAAFAFAAMSAWSIECLLMVPLVAWVAAVAFVVSKNSKKQKTL